MAHDVWERKRYGISILPEDSLPYHAGYHYGAYCYDYDTAETHIVEFFKTEADIQAFVNKNPKFGK